MFRKGLQISAKKGGARPGRAGRFMTKHQRILLFACVAVYITAYIGRLSFTAAQVGILTATGATKADAGLVTTFFYFTYGCGQLVNAFFCRRYKPRPVIAGVLCVSAIANILVLILQDLALIKFVWLVNGAAQSMLWCTLIELLSHRIPKEHMSKATISMSITAACGTLAAYGIAAGCIAVGHVFLTFAVATAVLVAVMILWLICTRHLSSMPDYKKEEAPAEGKASFSGLFIGMATLIPLIGVLAIGNGFLKDTVTTWVPTLLYEEFGLPEAFSVIITLVLPLTAFFGTAFGLFLRRYIHSHTLLMGLLYAASALVLGVIYVARPLGSILLTVLCFAAITCFMAAVNNIVTFLIPMEQKNSGMFAGIMDAFCYVGSTLSGFLPGLIIDGAGFGTLLFCLPITAVVFAAVSLIGSFRRKKPGVPPIRRKSP